MRNSHFQSWTDWQAKFNEKEKRDKRQFAEAFSRKIEAQQDEFGNLFTHANKELYDDPLSRYIEDRFADGYVSGMMPAESTLGSWKDTAPT